MSVYELNRIKAEFEQVMDAFQGLEQVASKSDGYASDVASAMVPIIFQMELVCERINLACEKPKPSDYQKDNVIRLDFDSC